MNRKYRKTVIAGNWKMNKTPSETKEFMTQLKAIMPKGRWCDVALCVPAVDIPAAVRAVRETRIGIGAENCNANASGAYTGEIATNMLVDAGCKYVIIGHSERRAMGETDADVNAKVLTALENGLVPIMCVGESLEQRESGITFIFVTHDQEEALTMSDRVAVMSAGHILQLGTPEDIYNEPQSAFVADFIGDSDIMAGTMVRDRLVRFLGCDFPCVDTGFGENADVDVVLRPEDVKLKPIDDPVQGVPQGVVESLLFKGVHYEMKVRVGDSVLLVHSTHARPVGTQVKLTVAPEDIQVMHKSDYSPDRLKRHAARA